MKVFLRILLLGLFIGGGGELFAQGSLTPPGAPAPTMKSLSEIDAHENQIDAHIGQLDTHIAQVAEKRSPISAPTTISSPGSYYLTGNINAPDGVSGIQVAADNVTIDLNGFAIIGEGTSGFPSGIVTTSAQTSLYVKNGTITGFHGAGIGGTGSSRFEHLIISGNGGAGIDAASADDGEVVDCVVTHNQKGILVRNGWRIVNSVVSGSSLGYGINGQDHVAIESCTIAGNPTVGVVVRYGALIHNCLVRANASPSVIGLGGIICSGGSRILDNLVDANKGDGIATTDNASEIQGNTCTYNSGYGIFVSGAQGQANLVVRNSCRGNQGGGLSGNYDNLQNSTTNVFGRIIDMSTPGMIPDSYGPWSNISY